MLTSAREVNGTSWPPAAVPCIPHSHELTLPNPRSSLRSRGPSAAGGHVALAAQINKLGWRGVAEWGVFPSGGASDPIGPGRPHYQGFTITPHSLGPLWTSDQPVAETSTWQHTTFLQETNFHVSGRIGTLSPSKPAAADPCLRPRGHWDRPKCGSYCAGYRPTWATCCCLLAKSCFTQFITAVKTFSSDEMFSWLLEISSCTCNRPLSPSADQ